jgi:hypothetical protein
VGELKAALQASSVEDEDEDDAPVARAGGLHSATGDSAGSAAVSTVAHANTVAAEPGSASGAAPAPAAAAYMYADASGTYSKPVPVSTFPSLFEAGYVDDDTLVWTAGMAAWQPARTRSDIMAAVGRLVSAAPQPAATAASSAGEVASSSGGAAGGAAGVAARATGTKRPRPADGAGKGDGESDSDGASGDEQADDGDSAAAAAVAGSDAQSSAASAGDGQPKKKKKKGKAGAGGGWSRPKENPWVYVTGLPPDVTEDELAAHFRKCGILKMDSSTGR